MCPDCRGDVRGRRSEHAPPVQGHYRSTQGPHVTVIAACSRPVIPFRPGRPVRAVGGFRSAQRVLGNFRAIRDVHGKAQLVFAGGLDSGSGHHCNVRGRLVGPLPSAWMAHAHSCSAERNSPDPLRGHDGGCSGSEGPSGFFRLLRCGRSPPLGNLYGVSCQCGPAASRNEQVKAARTHEFGSPEVIRIDDVPQPTPNEGAILVRVAAAGVGLWDALLRERKPSQTLL